MNIDTLKNMSKDDIHSFIRKRLAFDSSIFEDLRYVDEDLFKKEHKRFEMSGYEGSHTGECTLSNLSIVNLFADLGIYDYTDYLFLDFYKGMGVLYLKYFQTDRNIEIDLGGYRTVDIIYEIFKVTIFSGRRTRRRG